MNVPRALRDRTDLDTIEDHAVDRRIVAGAAGDQLGHASAYNVARGQLIFERNAARPASVMRYILNGLRSIQPFSIIRAKVRLSGG